MALKPKSELLQVRVEPELLERFRAFAESNHSTVSEAIRHFMRVYSEQYEKRLERARAAQASKGAPDTATPQKTAQKPVKPSGRP